MQNQKQNLYIGGDFNCVQSPFDKVSGSLDKSSNALSKLKEDLNLIDVWRAYNPNQKEFSFIDPTRKGRDSRIDLWLIPKPVIQNVNCCKITQAPAPDHKAVILDIRICNRTRGKGYWKLNNSVINEDKYKEGITDLYKEVNRRIWRICPKRDYLGITESKDKKIHYTLLHSEIKITGK